MDNNNKIVDDQKSNPKSRRWKIITLWTFLIFNPITITRIINPDPYEFGALVVFIIVSIIWILVAILFAVSSSIIKRNKEDGITYDSNNYPIFITIIKIISIIFILISLSSLIFYIAPIVGNYKSFKFIESSLSQQTIDFLIGPSSYSNLYIKNIIISNYVILRYLILLICSLILYFIYIRKYSISKMLFLWLMTIVLIFSKGFLLDTSVYTKSIINKVNLSKIERIIEFESAMRKKSCFEIINNLDDRIRCEQVFNYKN